MPYITEEAVEEYLRTSERLFNDEGFMATLSMVVDNTGEEATLDALTDAFNGMFGDVTREELLRSFSSAGR